MVFRLTPTHEFYRTHRDALCVEYIRDDWRGDDGICRFRMDTRFQKWQKIACEIIDGQLAFALNFHGERGHTVRISATDGAGMRFFEYVWFYSLKPDLFGLRAYKGNLHTHSTGSDGRFSPMETALRMRCAGFDFTAITDHWAYEPSLEAAGALRHFDSGFECYPGEECGSDAGVNHILSIGASSGVSRWQREFPEEYAGEVKKHETDFVGLPAFERRFCAQFETITAKIAEYGGVSVFAHPYWRHEERFSSPPRLTDAILRRGRFDALELGNYDVMRTAMMNAKLMEIKAEYGFDKPLLGGSDWHGIPQQKTEIDYTIILAPSPRFEDFRDAIAAGRCIAVGGRGDEFLFGSARLVGYAWFLVEKFFRPRHDAICRIQGEHMAGILAENSSAVEISRCKSKLQELYNTFF